MPWDRGIKATTDHSFTDPHTNKHSMASRVGKDGVGNWYVWLWIPGQVGWVFACLGKAGSPENVQKLLDLPYEGPKQ